MIACWAAVLVAGLGSFGVIGTDERCRVESAFEHQAEHAEDRVDVAVDAVAADVRRGETERFECRGHGFCEFGWVGAGRDCGEAGDDGAAGVR